MIFYITIALHVYSGVGKIIHCYIVDNQNGTVVDSTLAVEMQVVHILVLARYIIMYVA